MHEKCPHDTVAYLPACLPHIYRAENMSDFLLNILWKIATISDDEQMLIVHYGMLRGNLNRSAFLEHSALLHLSMQADNTTSNNWSDNVNSYIRNHVDVVQLLRLMILHNSSWSFRSYEYFPHVQKSEQLLSNLTLSEAVSTIEKKSTNKIAINNKLQEKMTIRKRKKHGKNAHSSAISTSLSDRRRLASNNKKKQKPKPHPIYGLRTFKVTSDKELCTEIHPIRPVSNVGMISNNKHVIYSTNPIPQNATLYPTCVNLLPDLYSTGKPIQMISCILKND